MTSLPPGLVKEQYLHSIVRNVLGVVFKIDYLRIANLTFSKHLLYTFGVIYEWCRADTVSNNFVLVYYVWI